MGANYTPRIGWFHSWADLDPALVDEDMAQIAQLGLDHVRIFPLWPLLQPNRTLISSRAVQDVLTVVDIAGRHGLAVSVDLLQGHLSSYDFLPAWVSTWHRRNLFTDPLVLAAQQQLARVLGTELADRPHVSGMTLGNEIGQFAVSYHPDRHDTSDEQATAWTRDLLAVVDEVLPGRRNHHSFDDCLWFKDDHPFTPADAVLLGASTTVHSWVFTGAGQALGEGHPGLALFGRYLTEVASAWNRALGQADRKVWLQEIGAPVPWVAPQDAAEFADASVRTALGNPDVEAVTWWCSHDVHRDLADFPEVEYSLGLFDAEGRLKPIGEAYGAIARELRDGASAGAGADASPAASTAAPVVLEGMDRAGSDRSRLSPKGDIFRTWAEAALDGEVSPLEIRF
ncbi:hypothetical protein BF93_12845 [Brachybacterium phenoliresistens]|uniref:Glycosyl hydrolase n=1 Tax=Brachybacterium phenoliresistens TaxID=396014 RepID=Z9JPB2_9MICO|nr:hypothetical protein BF93_12845 [Brachybacterium phenoliresistens]